MPEYSVKGPAIISDSPSTRSNGVRFVSATAAIKKIMNARGCMKMNQLDCACICTMSSRRSDPVSITTPSSEKSSGAS